MPTARPSGEGGESERGLCIILKGPYKAGSTGPALESQEVFC